MTLPGGAEWLIILFIVLLLFGAKKLPGLAGSMGESIKEFRRSAREADAEDEAAEQERREAAEQERRTDPADADDRARGADSDRDAES